MKQALPALLLCASLAAQADWDCTTEKGKAEAANDFLWEHYDLAGAIVYPPEDGLIEVYFYPYQPDGSEEPECTGRVRVDNQCRVLDAEGRSLDDAALREKTLTCS